ncbi:MAG: TIGR02147 family protein [Chitinivibrionales bacterium]|nr:TIGR02147 family protein [Chitinivibrionales bacterium]
MKSIYEYLEYRDFLRDFYLEKKNQHAFFSYQYLGNKTGVDVSYVAKLLNRKIHISSKFTSRICSFLKLSEKESEYFELLVAYGKARKFQDKKIFLEKLATFRASPFKLIDQSQEVIFFRWYTTVLFELLNFFPVSDDYEQVGQLIEPPVSGDEVKQSLAILELMGFIEKKEGFYKPTYNYIQAEKNSTSSATLHQKQQTAMLALRALDQIPNDERMISIMTVTLSPRLFRIFNERLQELGIFIANYTDEEPGPIRVYQYHFHIFPLSKDDSETS